MSGQLVTAEYKRRRKWDFREKNREFYRKTLCSSYLWLKYKNNTILTPAGSSFTGSTADLFTSGAIAERLHKQDLLEFVKMWRKPPVLSEELLRLPLCGKMQKAWREVLRLRSTKNKSRPMAAWIFGGGEGSWTPVSTEFEADLYIHIPLLLFFVLCSANGRAGHQTISPLDLAVSRRSWKQPGRWLTPLIP